MTEWYCDGCGRKMSALASIERNYGVVNFKSLCVVCAQRTDAAALKVLAEIRAVNKPVFRTPLQMFRQWLG